VEFVPPQRHRRQLLITYLDPKRVAVAVQLRADPQVRVGRGRPDQLDDHLMASSGRPRQFTETAQEVRFELSVPFFY
jgi:hypothetical protein